MVRAKAKARARRVKQETIGIVKDLHKQYKHHSSAIFWIGRQLKTFGVDIEHILRAIPKVIPKVLKFIER